MIAVRCLIPSICALCLNCCFSLLVDVVGVADDKQCLDEHQSENIPALLVGQHVHAFLVFEDTNEI